ncbi:hypothetical protein JKF63_06131 [Porcisia hertigi]|uniref:Protein phosphatase 2A regulatory subunit n=1 Tax=Porcisia hertigi TaxID=2761500 RepID=A0A836LFZ2_9TRYP|nr:hypothetical protein JKF63_06131 [Porcisia hertigi]
MSNEDPNLAACGAGTITTSVESPPLLSSLTVSSPTARETQELRTPFIISDPIAKSGVASPAMPPTSSSLASSNRMDEAHYRGTSPSPRIEGEAPRTPLYGSSSRSPSPTDMSDYSHDTPHENALDSSASSSFSSSSLTRTGALSSTSTSSLSATPPSLALCTDVGPSAQPCGTGHVGSASALGIYASLNGVSSGGKGSSSPSTSPNRTAASCNPRISMNAAFALNPRTESDASASEAYNDDTSSVCLDLDLHDPPVKKYYNLGSLEERRTFVKGGCIAAAQGMSTPRILDHLLPALLTAFEADDYGESFDDCAPCIARALPQIIACVEPRSAANLTYFMGLIMELCCSAEEVVAKVITTSLQAIFEMVEDKVLLDLFLPFVMAMRISFWIAPRVVAAGLLGHLAMRPAVLQASGLSVSDMFDYYAECSSDTSGTVRSAVVTSLHDWVRVAAVHRLTLAEMPLPLLKRLATDDLSDTVRYLLIEEVVKLAPIIGPKSTSKYLLGTFLSAYMDPSWRVRYTAANQLGAMAALVLNADDLEGVMETLGRDEEPETRAAVARQLDCMVQHCSSVVVQHGCVPVAVALSQDTNPVVRLSVARHYHFFLFGNDEVIRTMCKTLQALMQDAAFSVQENAIENLGKLVTALEESVEAAVQESVLVSNGGSIGKVDSSSKTSHNSASRRHSAATLATANDRGSRHKSPHPSSHLTSGAVAGGGPDSAFDAHVTLTRRHRADGIVHSFMTEVLTLCESRNWRIRHAVMRTVHHFCRALSPEQYRPLTEMLFLSLHDPVSAVRSQAVRTLKEVAKAYGGEWAAQTATELLNSDTLAPTRAVSYMWRVVMIECLEVLLPVVSKLSPQDMLRQHLIAMTLPLLQNYVTDRVPNVRLAAARALPSWSSWFDASEQERTAYNEAIKTLQQDTDIDVLNASHNILYNTNTSVTVADGAAH